VTTEEKWRKGEGRARGDNGRRRQHGWLLKKKKNMMMTMMMTSSDVVDPKLNAV